MTKTLSFWLAIALALCGCASTFVREPLSKDAVLLDDVPFVTQTSGFCGPAALAMVMTYKHPERGEASALADELAPLVVTPAIGGALQADMLGAVRRKGFQPKAIQGFSALAEHIDAGQPVVVLENLRFSWWPQWHYAVVIGVDPMHRWVIMHTGDTAEKRVSFERFLKDWQGSDQWGLVIDDNYTRS